jgi:hypothetical protein
MPFDEQSLRWLNVLFRVIKAARLVTVFDGTDRDSLEELRHALIDFTLIEEGLRGDN